MSERRRAAAFCLVVVSAFAFALVGGLDQATAQGTADLNADTMVNAQDQLLFMDQWHTGGTNVPADAPLSAQFIAEVSSVNMMSGVDNQPEVTFSWVDGAGNPIDLADISDYRFSIARIFEGDNPGNPLSNHYENYIAPEVANEVGDAPIGTVTATLATYDHAGRNGPLTDLGGGNWVYKFGDEVVMGPDDMTRTHTVAAQIRFNSEIGRQDINMIFHFVPDGSPVTVRREVANTQTCNTCHTKLGLHGGGRQEVEYCIVCHNPADGNFDPDSGNSIDMANMIHKIHRGANLPSAPTEEYIIYGHNNSEHNYSNVHFPQDIRNCQACHTGSGIPGNEQADNWKKVPSRRTCGACHDDVDFVTGAGHGAGIPQADDSSCTGCHPADTGGAAAIAESHIPPRKNDAFPDLMAEILEVTDVAPGSAPTVKFKITQDVAGVVSDVTIGEVGIAQITMAGPTVDYATRTTDFLGGFNVVDNGDGSYSHVMSQVIDASAEGTYAFGVEARMDGIPELENANPSAANPVVYMAVTGDLVERRQVVDFDKCNVCHDQILFHGSLRREYEYCVMCHRPGQTDAPFRDPATDAVTVNMKDMIHLIHTGAELEGEYTVIGFMGSVHDYTEVHFSGDTRKCELCHLPGTYDLPTPDGALDTVVTDVTGTVVLSTTPPMTAACVTCHDGDTVAAHAESFIALEGGDENCAECHGPSKEWAVDLVHWTP